MNEILHETPRERNMAAIGLIALRHGVTRHDVLGRSRLKRIVMARQDCAVMLQRQGLSTVQIGKVLNRDHSTIVHALQQWREKNRIAALSPNLLTAPLASHESVEDKGRAAPLVTQWKRPSSSIALQGCNQ